MFAMTGANVGNPPAIVVDGKVLSAPIIRSAILDRGAIERNFTNQEIDGLIPALQASMPRAEN